MKLKTVIIFICCLLYAGTDPVSAQYPRNPLKDQKQYVPAPRDIFLSIEEGIAMQEIDKFSKYFDSQTYLSLSNGISGYYSANQVFYILQDFFRIYQPVNFRFLSVSDKSETPYASGYYRYESKGLRGTSQIYIALKKTGSNWKISQITIN
ncbi:MAG: DUF4783 domain-containing protein [Syntrophothermus sp.]